MKELIETVTEAGPEAVIPHKNGAVPVTVTDSGTERILAAIEDLKEPFPPLEHLKHLVGPVYLKHDPKQPGIVTIGLMGSPRREIDIPLSSVEMLIAALSDLRRRETES